MNNYIYIQVNTNDADYIGEYSLIDEDELVEILPLVEKIKDFKYVPGSETYNFYYKDSNDIKTLAKQYDVKEELIENFILFCPDSEYGFHTIEEVLIFKEKPIKII